MDKEKFEANDVIIRQGNKGNNFYILIDGEVAVYKNKINKSTKNGVEVEEGLSGADVDDWSNGHNYDQVATLKAGNYTYALIMYNKFLCITCACTCIVITSFASYACKIYIP